MPRPARFTDDDVLDAALTCAARDGHATTVADVAAELDGPVGSIYHRFASREALLVRLWLRSVGRFQAGLFELAGDPDPHRALVQMALHVPRYCRDRPDEARALTLYRQDRLQADGPVDLREDVAAVNTRLEDVTRRLTRRRYHTADKTHLLCVLTATRLSPYGLVRPYLGGPVPAFLDDAVAASSDAILRLGDERTSRRRAAMDG